MDKKPSTLPGSPWRSVYGTSTEGFLTVSSERGFEPVRRKVIWQIRLAEGQNDDTLRLDAVTGEILNVSSNVDLLTDATVRRWGYTNGALDQPYQVVSENFYTRDDNTLVHDFFHVVNDERMGGDLQTTCDARFDSSDGSGFPHRLDRRGLRYPYR